MVALEAPEPLLVDRETSLAGHRQSISYPGATKQLDYEIEMAFVIGRRCKHVRAGDWREVVYGYTIYNDLSMRDIQSGEMQAGLLLLGKNFDGAAPMGPWLVTADEVPDPHGLDICLKVNGAVRQEDTLSFTDASGTVVARFRARAMDHGAGGHGGH